MKKQKINKGRKNIFHLPKFTCKKETYEQYIKISETMLSVIDSNDPGWSKLWGISMGHIHWNNSFRFVFRVIDNEIKIGWYAYIGGVSPQISKIKGYFNLKINIGDEILMKILSDVDNNITMILCNKTTYLNSTIILDKPKGLKFPISYCFPNIKDKATETIYFDFHD